MSTQVETMSELLSSDATVDGRSGTAATALPQVSGQDVDLDALSLRSAAEPLPFVDQDGQQHSNSLITQTSELNYEYFAVGQGASGSKDGDGPAASAAAVVLETDRTEGK